MQSDGLFFETLKNKEYYFQDLLLKLTFSHFWQTGQAVQCRCWGDNWQYTWWAWPEPGDHMGRPGGGTSINTLSEMTRRVRNMKYRYGVTGLVEATFSWRRTHFIYTCHNVSPIVKTPESRVLVSQEDRSPGVPDVTTRPGLVITHPWPAADLLISSSSPASCPHVPSPAHIVTPSATGARKWKILISINLL